MSRETNNPIKALEVTRGVDPYGTRGTCPPIFMKGETSMVMSPQYFRSDV